MGCVQQAVLEFDEEVRAPWRPRLVAVAGGAAAVGDGGGESALPARPVRTPSRVGACRPREVAVPRMSGARSRPLVDLGGPAGASAAGARRGVRSTHGPRPRTPMRLTRRARRFAIVLALVAGVALGSWLGPLFDAGGDGGLRLAGVTSVVVQPGDTLWSIAAPVAGGGDVRATVAEIRRLNGLTSALLVPGQTLRLP